MDENARSQGRDGIVKVWDAERFTGGGPGVAAAKNQRSGPGNTMSGALTPEPLVELSTGAFHFCQFALTRWREEPTAKDDRASGSSVHEESGSESRQGRGAESNRDPRSNTLNDVDPEMGLQGVPREGSGGRSFLGGEGQTRAQSSGEDPGSTREGTGVAPAATVPTEECLSSGSFVENVMLAPCNEQHSVSVAMTPIHARPCPIGAFGDRCFVLPLRSVEIMPASPKLCATPEARHCQHSVCLSRFYDMDMSQVHQNG